LPEAFEDNECNFPLIIGQLATQSGTDMKLFLKRTSTCCFHTSAAQIQEIFLPVGGVPDKRNRILEVVVVRRLLTWVLGIWSGEGMGKG
jgi:hypothetical protein